MTTEEYFKSLSIMAQLEGKWYRDQNGLYVFYNESEVGPEAIEAAEILNQNYIKATEEWDRFIEMYGDDGDEIPMKTINASDIDGED